MSTSDKFARLSALKPARDFPQKPPPLRAPTEEDPISRLLGGGIARNCYGEHLAIRNWFSTPEFVQPSSVALELLSRTRDQSLGRRTRAALENPEKWLFLDTETTGLSGGTGTYAFLVGLAWWDGGGLQVEQLFLRDFSEEHSLLHELADRLAERPVLVTFNGKTFDWPLLENRFTMTRAIRVPQLAAHLDLLHPARALWKFRLGSVRLVELEQHVLDAPRRGWRREDDVASALIPQFYFDYLRGGTGQPLIGVVKHNQMDLRGLAALFGKINALLASREAYYDEADSLDLFGLSKFLHRKGEKELAHSACAKALQAGLPADIRPQATRDLALMAKRRGDRERAAELWEELITHSTDGVVACEQLAIHYERHARDFTRAAKYTQLSLKKLRDQVARSRDPYAASRAVRLERKLLCRLERLQHRIKGPSDRGRSFVGRLGRGCFPSPIAQFSEPLRIEKFGGTKRMDSLGTKQQISGGGTMATTEISYLRNELEVRRQRLLEASRQQAADVSLRQLLSSVDAALTRLDAGTFGVCEQCHESIEADRLICDPLIRFCLDHLSQEEQRALENDLSMAARIQRTLLPRPDWSIDGWRARYHYQPANLVSGDYCDLIETQDGFLFLLGDVAGKGVAASMLMSHLHATFRTLAGQRLPLSMLMEHANRLFCESTTAGQFATMIVGSATPDGRVEYVSAGHLPLFHVSATGARPREATGVPLGMFSSTEFPVCEVRMAPGDKLLLYTDGLTETADAAGKEYGVARVQALAKTHAAAEAQDLVAACLDEVRSFSANAKQADDLTLLVLHRTH